FLNNTSSTDLIRLKLDARQTLSSVVRDTIKAVQLSTRFGAYGKAAKGVKSNFPFHIVVSTQKNAGLHGHRQMEWQLVENNCTVAFDGSRFAASDVKTIVENVLDVITCVSKDPELAVGDIAFSNVSQQLQRAQISTQLPPAPSHTFTTLSEAFQDTVAKHSGNIAIVDEDRAFTYSELDALSSALANKIAQALDGSKDSGFVSCACPTG
ncbi:hypothetical protein MPER_06207, partial [Moniliophthora perniciosa FA553]